MGIELKYGVCIYGVLGFGEEIIFLAHGMIA
jgi:hypothetical protein